jgi:Ser/Thr protein kinase RdoA (MazF antagonist)
MAPQEKSHYARVTDAIAESLATAHTACPASTTDEDSAWVNALVCSAREALEEPFTPRLILHDFTTGNVNAELREERWRIVGVFDLHESYFGDGEEGLSRTFCNYLPTPAFAEAFLTAYASRQPLRPGFAMRFPIYVLADCLHIWAFGHTRANWYAPSLRLRVWLEPTLVAVEQLLRSQILI